MCGLTVSSKRIKSLRNPAVKMSKSDVDQLSSILLTDSADIVREKVRKAVTDMNPMITYDLCGRPGVSNLVDIASAFTEMTVEQVCESARHFDTVAFKNFVSDVVIERLQPIRSEITRLLSDVEYLSKLISDGNDRAAAIANDTYSNVRRLVGFQWLVSTVYEHSLWLEWSHSVMVHVLPRCMRLAMIILSVRLSVKRLNYDKTLEIGQDFYTVRKII